MRCFQGWYRQKGNRPGVQILLCPAPRRGWCRRNILPPGRRPPAVAEGRPSASAELICLLPKGPRPQRTRPARFADSHPPAASGLHLNSGRTVTSLEWKPLLLHSMGYPAGWLLVLRKPRLRAAVLAARASESRTGGLPEWPRVL